VVRAPTVSSAAVVGLDQEEDRQTSLLALLLERHHPSVVAFARRSHSPRLAQTPNLPRASGGSSGRRVRRPARAGSSARCAGRFALSPVREQPHKPARRVSGAVHGVGNGPAGQLRARCEHGRRHSLCPLLRHRKVHGRRTARLGVWRNDANLFGGVRPVDVEQAAHARPEQVAGAPRQRDDRCQHAPPRVRRSATHAAAAGSTLPARRVGDGRAPRRDRARHVAQRRAGLPDDAADVRARLLLRRARRVGRVACLAARGTSAEGSRYDAWRDGLEGGSPPRWRCCRVGWRWREGGNSPRTGRARRARSSCGPAHRRRGSHGSR